MSDMWEISFLIVAVTGTFYIAVSTKLWILLSLSLLSYYLYDWYINRNADWKKAKGKAVLITGCDTGFGHDLARRLDELGCIVFAGCLHADGHGARTLKRSCSKRMHVVPMDVGSDESVTKALHYVKAECPKAGLWGLVNNAGFNVMGDVELLGVSMYHKAMNVNFFGAARVARLFTYLVRRQKGRIVIMSSGRGCIPGPRDSAYHVTKSCLETFSDSLRMEMKKFGVNVSVIQPGHFGMATACQDAVQFERYKQEDEKMWGQSTEEQKQTYGRYYFTSVLDGQASSKLSSALEATPVIDAMVHALFWEKPKIRYLVSGSNSLVDKSTLIVKVYPFLPTWLSDYILTKRTACDTFPQK